MSVLSGLASRVGVSLQGDGVNNAPARQAKTGELAVQQTHGKYYEAAHRGNVYSAQTAATGVAPGTALGTTAAFCLHNPAGSGKNFVIQKISMELISGTTGSGAVHICSSNSGDAVPTGTAISPRNRLIGG